MYNSDFYLYLWAQENIYMEIYVYICGENIKKCIYVEKI